MPTNDKVTALIARWEEQGRTATPEEVCRNCPELLDEVRARIEALRWVGDLLRTAPSAAGETTGGGRLPSSRDNGRWRPGTKVGGYTLVEPIGRGGFGEVWRARGPSGFPVALKFVPYSGAAGDAEVRSLKLLRELRHPNLVSVFGAWRTEEVIVIAMELADRTLWDRFREAVDGGLPGIPRDELLEYTRQAALAIDYLNTPRPRPDGKAAGVAHRDIKPQNLLLFGGGVKVGDLGLARPVQGLAASHTGTLTPLYAPPEFFEGRTTPRSDQYSLAVTYCVLRGGRPPFAGEAAQVMAGHLHGLPDLAMLPEVERFVIMRALAKKAEQRWPSCQVFVDALAEALRRKFEMGGSVTPTIGQQVEVVLVPLGGRKPAGKSSGTPCWASLPRPGKGRGVRWLALGAAALLTLIGATVVIALGIHHRPVAWVADHLPRKTHPPGSPGGMTAPELRTFEGHNGRVWGVALSRDGRRAVSVGEDKTIRLWDVTTGHEVRRFEGNAKPVSQVAFLPDGRFVIGAGDGVLWVWSVDDETLPPRHLDGSISSARALCPLPDGHRVLWVGQLECQVWEVAAMRQVGGSTLAGVPSLNSAALSPQGDRLLLGCRGGVYLWDVEKGKVIRELTGHKDFVNSISFSADGKHAVSGSDDNTVRYWDVTTGKELYRFDGHTKAIQAVAFLPGDRYAASAGDDGTVRVWALPGPESAESLDRPVGEVFQVEGEGVGINALAVSPQGDWLMAARGDGVIRLERIQLPRPR